MDTEEEAKLFLCDDKYDVIISSLEEIGWQRTWEYDKIPTNCRFIFRNLSNITFPAIFGRTVNHFRNSQHLSNKALLAYHLRGSQCQDLQTQTWSAAFEDLPTLIGMTLLHSVKCLIVGLVTSSLIMGSDVCVEQSVKEAKHRYEVFHEILQVRDESIPPWKICCS